MKRQAGFEKHIEQFLAHKDPSEARVLEIGGDSWNYIAGRMVELGAEEIETINILPGWPDYAVVAPKIARRRLDCRNLSDVHPEASFDVIFGVAVAEHITGIPEFLNEAAKVLRPGGILYIHGGPLWTATKGHHLFHKTERRWYRFSDPDCPINRWEHLMHDENGLADLIAERGLDRSEADIIAHWVYNTEEQNRVGYNALGAMFDASPLDLVTRIPNAFFPPTEAELEAITRQGYDPTDRYDVSGVTHIMTRYHA